MVFKFAEGFESDNLHIFFIFPMVIFWTQRKSGRDGSVRQTPSGSATGIKDH